MSYLKKSGRLFRGGIMVGLALVAPALLQAADDGKDAYDTFLTLSKNNTVGVILAEIKFERDGSVKQCLVVRSNTPYALESSTVEYIREHWKNPFFAGDTRFVPITFDELPSHAAQWNEDMVPPLDSLSAGDPERRLKLRLTFGDDGWIKDIRVADTSGQTSLDQQTALWVKVHWHHDAYAGQVIDAPFRFEPPPPPVALPPPPPVVVKKEKPSHSTEPVPIPAERVQ